jgi:hypothetical protein
LTHEHISQPFLFSAVLQVVETRLSGRRPERAAFWKAQQRTPTRSGMQWHRRAFSVNFHIAFFAERQSACGLLKT